MSCFTQPVNCSLSQTPSTCHIIMIKKKSKLILWCCMIPPISIILQPLPVLRIVYCIVRPYKARDQVRWDNSFVCHISGDSKRLQHSCRQQSVQDQAWHELPRCDIWGLFSNQGFKDKQILVTFTSLSQARPTKLIIQGAEVSTAAITGNEA